MLPDVLEGQLFHLAQPHGFTAVRVDFQEDATRDAKHWLALQQQRQWQQQQQVSTTAWKGSAHSRTCAGPARAAAAASHTSHKSTAAAPAHDF
jgi:hypothetical protein